MLRGLVVVPVLCVCALAVGCKGGDGSDDVVDDEVVDTVTDMADTEDVPVDTAEDEVADVVEEEVPVAGPLTVTVVEAELTLWPYYVVESTDVVEGATVALDAPGGRSEQTTGTDGRVTFADVDWPSGTADVTVYKEDYTIHSVVGLDGSESEITVGLFLSHPMADFVTLSGTAQNMTDEAHRIGVYTTESVVAHEDLGPEWSLTVEPGVPFKLVGIEWDRIDAPVRCIDQDYYAWTVIDHAAVSADTTVTIDFATTLTPLSVDTSIVIPTVRPTSPLAGSSSIHGYISADGCPVGFNADSGPSSDGTAFDMSFDYIELTGATEIFTMYNLMPPDEWSQGFAFARVAGLPGAGTHDLGFLDIPNQDRSISSTYPLHDGLDWDLYDTGVEVAFLVWRAESGTGWNPIVWWVDTPTDATSLTIPDAPSTVDTGAVLGTARLFTRLMVYRPPDGDGIYRASLTKPLFLQP